MLVIVVLPKRVVSVVTVVLLLTAPTSRGASLLLDRDGDSSPIWGPINHIVHALRSANKWISAGIADDMIVPHP